MTYYTSQREIYNILKSNYLDLEVFYQKRPKEYKGDFIVFEKMPLPPKIVNDRTYTKRAKIYVYHYHEKATDSLEEFFYENFELENLESFEDDHCIINDVYSFTVEYEKWL